MISAVNWAETLSKLFDGGHDADAFAGQLTLEGLVG